MKKINTILPFLLVLLVAVVPIHAQTTTTTTTNSVAIADTTTNRVTLASGTNVAAGGYLFTDKELMSVVGAVNGSSTVWTVMRGVGGTVGTHAVASTVYVAAPGLMAASVFKNSAPPVGGSCTATAEAYLPLVHVPTGEVYNCVGSKWVITSGVPIVGITCGVANACSPAVKPALRVVQGITAALDGASPSVAAVTAISPAFTSTTSFSCTGTLQGATAAIAAKGVAVANTSTSAITFTSANGATEKIAWICVGY
jgi:hypothetical protein